jgi:hypothetical protein
MAGVDVVDDAQVGHEVELLVNRADLSLQSAQRARREPGRVLAQQAHLALSRGQRPVQQAEQCALARAAGADQRHALAGFDPQRDLAERCERAVAHRHPP